MNGVSNKEKLFLKAIYQYHDIGYTRQNITSCVSFPIWFRFMISKIFCSSQLKS